MILRKKVVPLPKLLKKAQEVFNKWVRDRDKENGCISCNGPVDHAGHYFNQGHHSFLRYNEINVNGQCVSCNLFKSGNLIKYRQGLVKKHGSSKVEELELKADLHKKWKWDRMELENIIEKYKTK
jgi:hypothetical protein